MLSKTQIEKRNAYFAYLIQNKEQTQEDFITLMNSDDKDLKDKVSQIFGKFEKFYSEVKWNSQTIKLKLLLLPLVL